MGRLVQHPLSSLRRFHISFTHCCSTGPLLLECAGFVGGGGGGGGGGVSSALTLLLLDGLALNIS